MASKHVIGHAECLSPFCSARVEVCQYDDGGLRMYCNGQIDSRSCGFSLAKQSMRWSRPMLDGFVTLNGTEPEPEAAQTQENDGNGQFENSRRGAGLRRRARGD